MEALNNLKFVFQNYETWNMKFWKKYLSNEKSTVLPFGKILFQSLLK